MAILAGFLVFALILAGYLLLAGGLITIWKYAPYVITVLFAFFEGPALMGIEGDFSPGWGTVWAIGVIPVVYVITKLPQLIIPYFLLIYTVILYSLDLTDNLIVFSIAAAIVVVLGVVSAYRIYGDDFWDNAFSNNLIVRIVARIISIAMYWYSIVVLESQFIISAVEDRTSHLYEVWKYLDKDVTKFDRMKGLPYLWVSFATAGIIGVIGFIIDFFNYEGSVKFYKRKE